MATCSVLVFRSLAITGNAGRYMSIEKGPNAVKEPKISMREKYFLLFIVESYNRSNTCLMAQSTTC